MLLLRWPEGYNLRGTALFPIALQGALSKAPSRLRSLLPVGQCMVAGLNMEDRMCIPPPPPPPTCGAAPHMRGPQCSHLPVLMALQGTAWLPRRWHLARQTTAR